MDDVRFAQVIALLVLRNSHPRIEVSMLRNLVAHRAQPLHALGYAFAGHRGGKWVNKKRRLHIMSRHPRRNPLDLLPNMLVVKSFSVERKRGGNHHAVVLSYAARRLQVSPFQESHVIIFTSLIQAISRIESAGVCLLTNPRDKWHASNRPTDKRILESRRNSSVGGSQINLGEAITAVKRPPTEKCG